MIVKEGFENYLSYILKKGYKQKTANEYRLYLYGAVSHSLLIDKNISDLKMVDIASIIESARTHGEYGPQRAVSVFRQYLKFLKDSGIYVPIDYRDIEVPHPPEKEQLFFTKEEFDRFVNAIPLDTAYGLRDRALYECFFSTGARISELLSLDRNKIDWAKKEAIVIGKGGGEGKIYFSDRAIEWVNKYLKMRGDNYPILFATVDYRGIRPLDCRMARKELKKHLKAAGCSLKFSPHAFRRGFCSYLLDNGATLKEVQALARHKSERTTLKVYCKITIGKAKETHSEIFNEKTASVEKQA